MKLCKWFFWAMLAMVAMVTLLSACAPMKDAVNPYNENFKCRASGDDGKCIDTPSAYKEARYPVPEDALANQTEVESQVNSQANRYRMLAELLPEEKKPILQAPKIMRVLLLPYKGENQELFMTRYVYVKIEDSDWILSNINEK